MNSDPRSDDEIRADVAITHESERWSDRYHDAVVRLLHDVEPLSARVQTLTEERDAAYEQGKEVGRLNGSARRERAEAERDAAVAARDAITQAVERLAERVREATEQWLYDGDTDRPVNDGYLVLSGIADELTVLAAVRAAVPKEGE